MRAALYVRVSTDAQAAHLRKEGHTIEPGKGKNPPKVRDWERSLQRL